jgi:hypothetical protein
MTKMKMFICLIFFYIPILILGQGINQDSIRLEKIADSIENERFSVSIKKRDIPGFIRRKLTKIDKTKFRIANEGEEFNSGDALQKGSLPNKRIVYIAHSRNFYIVTYEQGGFGRAYYSRIVKYQKRDIECITTLAVPPHANIDDFKRIMEKKELIKYVAEKSSCFD